MFPVEWVRVSRASELRPGELAYLHDFGMSLALVGIVNGYTVAVMLGADVSKCTTRAVADLGGHAVAIGDIRFEGDVPTMAKLAAMHGQCEDLVVSGADVLIIARPPSNQGHIAVKVGELPGANAASTSFAYRSWRICKGEGLEAVELFRRG